MKNEVQTLVCAARASRSGRVEANERGSGPGLPGKELS